VKRADKEITIPESIIDDYLRAKERETQEDCIKKIQENLKNLLG